MSKSARHQERRKKRAKIKAKEQNSQYAAFRREVAKKSYAPRY